MTTPFASYSLGDALLTVLEIFLLVIWIWILITIMIDLFRDDSVSGWGKAAWVFFLIFVPYITALIYLIARGNSMNERTRQAMADAEKRQRAYIQEVSGGSTASVADQIRDLSALKESGHLTDAEYEAAKSKILA